VPEEKIERFIARSIQQLQQKISKLSAINPRMFERAL
jgi:hypothetical protein